jgi:hypothetical protein
MERNEPSALTADAFLALIDRHLSDLWQVLARSGNRSLREVLRSAEALLVERAGMDPATFPHSGQCPLNVPECLTRFVLTEAIDDIPGFASIGAYDLLPQGCGDIAEVEVEPAFRRCSVC